MQKVNITLTMDDEKLRALEYYLKQQNTTVQKKLDEAVGQLYEQTVPETVRQFVEGISGSKPKRPTSAAKPPAGQRPKAEVKKGEKPDEQL